MLGGSSFFLRENMILGLRSTEGDREEGGEALPCFPVPQSSGRCCRVSYSGSGGTVCGPGCDAAAAS